MWPDETDGILIGGESLSHSPEEGINGAGLNSCSETCLGETVRDFMAITKALADENRVRVLLALERGELCVCQIVELMGLATSTVSKHMSILKQARLVDSRKEGRWMYYRLADKHAPAAVRQGISWIARSLGSDPQVIRDKKRLATICTTDPHELCVAHQGACRQKCK